jgi:threonine dehydrogenase-like Zn-dependent dehydrogenase
LQVLDLAESMISDRFALRDAARAFARAAERGALKVLLQPAAG